MPRIGNRPGLVNRRAAAAAARLNLGAADKKSVQARLRV
ncbi:hypothetical protein B8V81_1060 [Paenibacillus pasadenensis]|uniref:Uncharacterized protein n=1 Tax=Paenibacillus pasadenensis TaxID=217090 RepID=A0A2N5N8Z7_9BACL|nr:hypothetical protein B8V81_1060 [Paenibacillus pasadenensis]